MFIRLRLATVKGPVRKKYEHKQRQCHHQRQDVHVGWKEKEIQKADSIKSKKYLNQKTSSVTANKKWDTISLTNLLSPSTI